MNADNTPLVSVIVLTYNQADTIARALDSVLAQKCSFEWELVLSDDGSTDSTRMICESYAQQYTDKIRLLPSAPNRGLVSNYFTALEYCRGKYIADCAGDDYWCDIEHLQRKVEILESDENITIASGDWWEVNDGLGLKKLSDEGWVNADIRKARVNGRNVLAAMLQHRHPLPIHLSASVYRHSVVKAALDSEKRYVWNDGYGCEDFPVMAALLSHGDMAWTDTPALVYTVGGETVSSPKDFRQNAIFFRKTTVMTIELARRYGVPLSQLRKSMGARTRYAMSQAYHARDYRVAKNMDREFKEAGLPRGLIYRFRLLLLRMVQKRK